MDSVSIVAPTLGTYLRLPKRLEYCREIRGILHERGMYDTGLALIDASYIDSMTASFLRSDLGEES